MGRPLRILVVEDNDDLAANPIDYLGARGHLVESVADGVSGFRLAGAKAYDVIVLDLVLPGMDGVTLCRRLREELGNRTPVPMLTARDSPFTARRSRLPPSSITRPDSSRITFRF